MKAEEILKLKLTGRNKCPKLLPNDDVILEEAEHKDDKSRLLGTVRHIIPLAVLANHLRSPLEDSSTDGPEKRALKLSAIHSNNEVKDDKGKVMGVKIPKHILDIFDSEGII